MLPEFQNAGGLSNDAISGTGDQGGHYFGGTRPVFNFSQPSQSWLPYAMVAAVLVGVVVMTQKKG